MKHETFTIPAPFDLFAVEPKVVGHDAKPRAAEATEAVAYARFLAERDGLPTSGPVQLNVRPYGRGDFIYTGATFEGGESGLSYSVVFPGSGREVVTLERLDDAGEVVGASTMPTDKKRGVVWDKVAIARAVGPMEKVKRPRVAKIERDDAACLRRYCDERGEEIRTERAGKLDGLVACFEAIVGAAQSMVFFPERAPAVEMAAEAPAPQAPESPAERAEPSPAPMEPPAVANAPEPASAAETDALETMAGAVGEIIGDLMRRVADLEARVALGEAVTNPIKSSAGMAENCGVSDVRQDRTTEETAENCQSVKSCGIGANPTPSAVEMTAAEPANETCAPVPDRGSDYANSMHQRRLRLIRRYLAIRADRKRLAERLAMAKAEVDTLEFDKLDLAARLAVAEKRAEEADGKWSDALDKKTRRVVELEDRILRELSDGRVSGLPGAYRVPAARVGYQAVH